MQYAILAMESEDDYATRVDPKRRDEYFASWAAYAQAIADSGIVRAGAGLEGPASATTVRIRGGSTEVQDGPYADTTEQLGGFFVIDVPDLDTALAWAARCPSAHTGSVEVRAVLPPINA